MVETRTQVAMFTEPLTDDNSEICYTNFCEAPDPSTRDMKCWAPVRVHWVKTSKPDKWGRVTECTQCHARTYAFVQSALDPVEEDAEKTMNDAVATINFDQCSSCRVYSKGVEEIEGKKLCVHCRDYKGEE